MHAGTGGAAEAVGGTDHSPPRAALLLWGTGVHVVDLVVGGADPCPWAPWWLAAYLVSLTVAGPVAAGLLLARRRLGMDLACLI
ncbi:hypothetical protein, partial [Micromonospora globispora]